MQVTVRVKPGRQFSRRESGRLITRTAATDELPFTVSQHVFERFRDVFEAVGDVPEPKAAPVGAAPGTDDALAPDPPADDAEDAGGGEEDEPDHAFEDGGEFGCRVCGRPVDDPEAHHTVELVEDPPASTADPLVAALAGVGLVVDPAVVSTWTDAERAKAQAVVGRNGKGTLPLFLKAAVQHPGE